MLYCDSDSVKWVTCTLLPFTLPFSKGAWELGPDCGSDLHGVLLILQVTTSSMLLITVFCFSELHNYCCGSYSKLRDISAPLLTKIIASFASHMNIRKCTRVYTLCSFISSLHDTHKHYSAYWLASLHEHISVYMQTHELCLLMLTGMCLTSSSLPVYYALSVVHAHQLRCNRKTGQAQCYNNAVSACTSNPNLKHVHTINYIYFM